MRPKPDAIILCGGAGSRLRPLTDTAKAVVRIGDRPFLEILFRQLRRWGISRVILAVGYRSDTICEKFGAEAFGLQIRYSQEASPLGTGGALRSAADLLESSTALVMNGDSYTDADLQKFEVGHEESGASMSVLVVARDGRDDCGAVSIDPSGRLVAFREKELNAGPKYINAGIYLLKREMLLEIPVGTQISLEKEVLPHWLERGKHIRAVIDSATCHDIGTPERYRKAQMLLADAEMGDWRKVGEVQ